MDRPLPLEKLRADFAGWHTDIQTIVELADRNACYRWSLFYRPPISNWSTRRATLLGDSVHATLPYLAQGAAMAIEDGVVLAQKLEETGGDFARAAALYQEARYLRTARVQLTSRFVGDYVYHPRGAAAEVRNQMLRNLSPESMAWLYEGI